jgi:hypothetical protein
MEPPFVLSRFGADKVPEMAGGVNAGYGFFLVVS